MLRTLLIALVMLLIGGEVWAQGFSQPPGSPLGRPAVPAPGRYLPNTVVWLQPSRVPGAPGILSWTRRPLIGTGYYANQVWFATPWAIPYGSNTPVAAAPAPAIPAAQLPVRQAAILTLDFPFDDTAVTVNGVPDPERQASRTYRTPELAPGEVHTLRIAANWTREGVGYEWEKVYRLSPGENVRVTILGGFRTAAAAPAVPTAPAPKQK